MNRRKAVLSIFIGGGAVAGGFWGYKLFWMRRAPDLSYLDSRQSIMADLAEVIIPRTDTPGAKEAGVGEFIIRLIKDVSDRKTQNNFIDGLKDLESYTSDHYGKRFSDLRMEDRQA